MHAYAVGSGDERITQGMVGLQTVQPAGDVRIGLTHVRFRTLHVLSPVVGAERVINHVQAASRQNGCQKDDGQCDAYNQFLFHRFHISQASKAWSNNISIPFFTTAPCSLPFFMNRVVSGL